jgi:hypothetical protein
MQELMKDGRKGVKEIDGTLNRAEKLVEDTMQIGQQVGIMPGVYTAHAWRAVKHCSCHHSCCRYRC